MAFSFALARHRLSAARAQSQRRRPDDAAPRPDGRLLWAHLSERAQSRGALLLLGDLVQRNPGLEILATGPWPADPVVTVTAEAPCDTGSASRRFLDHWRPDVILWIGTDPAPVLWQRALDRSLPIVGLEVDPAAQPLALVRPMQGFRLALARRTDRRLHVPIRAAAPLNVVPRPLRANESDLEDMTTLLATRPVWLAASVRAAEIDDILAAHRRAAQLAHRLLLVLELEDGAAGPGLRDRLVRQGWGVALRTDQDDPSPDVQILVADEPDETGLWIRLATVTFLGGSLAGPGPDLAPMVPASLGSVVLYGPRTGAVTADIERLAAADAAWRVADAVDLGRAVERFLAPEKAAEMASAAWSVTSEGADVSRRALDALDALVSGLDAS